MIIGAQLYSVRVNCQNDEDTKNTLKALKDMGYESVQVSGIPYNAEAFRAMADEIGLHIGLTHTSPVDIINDTDEVIRKHKVLGADVVGIGGLYGKYVVDGKIMVEDFIAEATPALEKIKAAGLKFAFHNHHREFVDYGGYTVMDQIFEKTDWNFTLDTGWAHVAGVDVLEIIEKYKDRLQYVHLKDFCFDKAEDGTVNYRIVPLYKGEVPVDAIIQKLIDLGITQVAYVEQDNASDMEDPIGEMKTSIDGLKAHGWVK